MADSVRVEFDWLNGLGTDLKRIGNDFEQVDDKNDFSVAVFGDQRIVDALGSFTGNWKDGRARIHEGVMSLGDAIIGAAKAYEKVDVDVKNSMDNGGGTNNGGANNGGNTNGGGTNGGGATNGGNTGGGNTGGGSNTHLPPVPPIPGGSVGTPVGPGGGTAPGGPTTDPVAPPADPPKPPPLGRDPWPGPIGTPLPILPVFPRPPGSGPTTPIDDPAVPTPAPELTPEGLRQQATDLRMVANDLRETARLTDDPEERQRLLAAADRLDVEANEMDQLAEQAEHVVKVDPEKGIVIVYDGPNDPEKVVIVVGDPGTVGDFTDTTLPNSGNLADEIGRQGHEKVGVVSWQDYGCADPPTSPSELVDQGAANLGQFTDDVRAQTGLPPEAVSVVGHGTGGLVADRALETGALGGSPAVTPTTLGIEEPAAAKVGDVAGPAVDGHKSVSGSSSMASPGMMMGLMAAGSMTQGIFFKGRGLENAAAASVSGGTDERRNVSAW